MTTKKPESFWDILIWVTVLMTAFMGVGILLNYIYPKWGRLIWILFLLLLAILKEIPFLKKWADKHFPEMLSVVAAVTAGAQLVLKFLALKKIDPSWIGWLFPIVIILMARKVYRDSQKKAEEARKQEELLREPQKLLAESLNSDKKALILLFNARMEDVSFEVDDRMVLYSLPDGRFLVLFRKQISLEDFLHALATFRTEVDSDEDAVGFYGQTFYGVKPDNLQAFVSDLSGVCRVVPFDLDSASLSGAAPV
jgi:hypothetical protein